MSEQTVVSPILFLSHKMEDACYELSLLVFGVLSSKYR